MNLDKVFNVESERVRKLLSNAQWAQRDVSILYQAVKKIPSVRKLFLVSFQIPNLSQYRNRLQLFLTPQRRLFLDLAPDRRPIEVKTRQHYWLKVCVDFDKEPEKASVHYNPQMTSYFEPSTRRPESSIGSPSDKQGRIVKSHHLPNIAIPKVREQTRPAKVVSLGEFSDMIHGRKSEAPPLYGNIMIGDATMLIRETDMLSLRDIFQSSIRISYVNRIRIAALLTWDVICLMGTPWMKQGVKAADIFVSADRNIIRLGDLSICHSFEQEDFAQIDQRSLSQCRIFRLGVILLELSLSRNIDDLQEGQRPDHIPDELAERVLISRMIDVVYAESGTQYGNLVRECVLFQSDSNLSSQHPKTLEDVQNLLLRNVFSPLQDLLKLCGSLDTEATINVPGYGALIPETESSADDSTIEDRAPGLHEPSTRPPIEDFRLEHLSILRQYASQVYQKCDADTFAFTQVMLAGM